MVRPSSTIGSIPAGGVATAGRHFCSSPTKPLFFQPGSSAFLPGCVDVWMCGLPKLFHPLFAARAVERAMQDRYLLIFADHDGLAAQLKESLNPETIHRLRE